MCIFSRIFEQDVSDRALKCIHDPIPDYTIRIHAQYIANFEEIELIKLTRQKKSGTGSKLSNPHVRLYMCIQLIRADSKSEIHSDAINFMKIFFLRKKVNPEIIE